MDHPSHQREHRDVRSRAFDGDRRSGAAGEENWRRGMDELAKYAAARGHTRVPPDLHTDDGFPLGWWVVEQRVSHLEGRMDATRAGTLAELTGWTWEHTTGRPG